ncbi:MAG: hypothetical protein WKG00_12270 [Polyangiaceae bacterium]
MLRTAWQRARRTPLHAALAVLATLATAAVIVVPLAVVRYPPMVDLPAHAAQSATFRHYLDASWHFQEQFELRPFEVPYLSFYAVGALAMLVLPPPAAMKVAVAVMLALLPLGLALLLRGMRKSPLLAVCALPLLWNPLVHWGFLNYLGALGLQAASVGLTLLVLERPTRARQVALCAALCAVFFSHVFRFPFAVATVVGTTLLMAPLTRRVWPVVPALAPPLLLFGAWWVMRPPSLQAMPELAFYPDRGGELVESLVGAFQGNGERRALAFAAAMLALIATLAVVARWALRAPPPARRERRWRQATTLVALGCAATSLALFFALPMQVGTWWYIYPREAVAAAFLALALLPDLPRAIGVRGAAVAGAVVAALPLTALVTRSYASFDEETRGFASLVQQRRRRRACSTWSSITAAPTDPSRRSRTCRRGCRPSEGAGSATTSSPSVPPRCAIDRAPAARTSSRRPPRRPGKAAPTSSASRCRDASSIGSWCAASGAATRCSPRTPPSSWWRAPTGGGSIAARPSARPPPTPHADLGARPAPRGCLPASHARRAAVRRGSSPPGAGHGWSRRAR